MAGPYSLCRCVFSFDSGPFGFLFMLLAYPPKPGAKQQKSCKNTGVAFVDISGFFHNLRLLYLLVDFIVVVVCISFLS